MIGHDPDRIYRAAVIGAGSGGLTAAIGLAGFGHDVVLIEGGSIGGDCTNVGCIPSKALLHASRRGHPDPLGWARGKRDELARREAREMADDEHIHLVRGWASLTDRHGPHVVRVVDGDTVHEVRARHVVVAGGSRPLRIDVDGLDEQRVVTNEELFELPELPSALLIVGGGPIALEMATAFHAIGVRVDIVEMQDRLLANEDPLITDVIERALTARGIGLHLGTTIDRVDGDTAHLADGSTIHGLDRVLMAVGRRPRLEGLGLAAAGVVASGAGIVVDDWGRTSVDGIWAVGDVTGSTLTTHGANAVGRRIVRAIAFPRLPKTGALRAIPDAVYSDPEVASVGIGTADLRSIPESSRIRIVVDHADVDRGYTDDIADGRLVLDVERFTGRVLRAAIVGPGASDLIGIFTMAIDQGIGLRKLFGMVHPYPSHAEIVREAADRFARATYPSLAGEWFAMARGRNRRLRRASRRTPRVDADSDIRTHRR
jgi:pyruvate/2-oxoglutarate dehydrogenase complex dihydrolipoamide dehydrogenase (E3) component